jgi:GNAT superfamily N-acetyltransferase
LRRDLGDGLELDDERDRIDREAVHRYLSEESYWARGRGRDVQDALIDASQRVVGLYDGDRAIANSLSFGLLAPDGSQAGFARVVTDRATYAYLADVYVLEEFRGRGLGVELVRFSVDEGSFAGCRWLLHTADAHDLYRKFGFTAPDVRLLERQSPARADREQG